jgi:hypothetical protein
VAHFPAESNQLAAALSARAEYHETYLESTANGEGNAFFDEWTNAIYLEEALKLQAAGLPFPRHWNGKFKFFWPWWNQPEYRSPLTQPERQAILDTMDEEEGRLVEEFQCSPEQLAWRRRKIASDCTKQSAMLPVEFFRQEWPSFPEEAFVARSTAVFDIKKLNIQLKQSEALTPFFSGYLLRDATIPEGWKPLKGPLEGAQYIQWEPPRPGRAYVMGVDAAEGLDHGDWSVISVFDRTDGTKLTEAARYRAKTPARELGEITFFLGTLYNEAYAVVERNSPGNSTCEKLVELGYGGNMFHHRNIETITDHENPEAFTAGFRTTQNTKAMLVHRGVTGIRDDDITLRHPEAIREWKGYVNDNGTYGAPSGRCDDCVMADLLALFGAFEAPPVWTTPAADTFSPDDKLTPEQRQDAYWKARIQAVKERSHKANQAQIALLHMRGSIRNPFN